MAIREVVWKDSCIFRLHFLQFVIAPPRFSTYKLFSSIVGINSVPMSLRDCRKLMGFFWEIACNDM